MKISTARLSVQLCIALLAIGDGWRGLHAETPQLSISAFALDALTWDPPITKEVAEQLSAQKWCDAAAADSAGPWNQVPAGIDRGRWVSIVTVGFNEQADAYAFMFDGPMGAVSLASHVAFRKTWMPSGVMVWVWPFDDLLGALRVDYEKARSQVGREPLALSIVPWNESTVAKALPAEQPNLSEARVLAPQMVFNAAAVMAHAAAFEAGWAPRSVDAPWSAICQVRVEDQSCSFRLTLAGPNEKHVVVKEHVPWEAYHDYLVRIFRFAKSTEQVGDFEKLAGGNVELLALREQRLACLVNQELVVFDLTTGKKLWTTEPSGKPRT